MNTSSDLFDLIREREKTASKGHRKIAGYILDHYDKAEYLTAAKLGESVGVSESTVVRFASDLGFSGYPEFQRALREAARNKLTAVQRIEQSRLKPEDVFSKVLKNDIEHIRQTLEETDENNFNSAVDSIISAKHIYILGVRSSASLASFMGYYFQLMRPDVVTLRQGSRSELFEQLMRLEEGDLLIGISFPRYSRQTVQALAYARRKGAGTIAITDSLDSPIAENAGNVLLARSDMVSFVDSLVAPMSLINALIAAVSLKNHEEVEKSFSKLEEIWDEYDVYQKSEDGDSGV
ncbi:MAG: MurR/RpiR family transcriptional regulator [Oscillospiraceae bacterium]|nr:MurR/RpiR family transcriptional regulator [Oscillospiraceae bacterium]